MFLPALFTIGKIQKQSMCLPMEEKINKMNMHDGYYSALKRKEILLHGTCMNLEDIV
jgi:hypothetical protein